MHATPGCVAFLWSEPVETGLGPLGVPPSLFDKIWQINRFSVVDGGMSEVHPTIHKADLSQPEDQAATLHLLNAYAMDPMGDGKPLSETARREVISGLRAHPTTLVLLACRGSLPVGLAICFRGFSTFAARPLINISDYFVLPGHRGSGIGRALLAAVEQCARELGCCRLTLEVQENNHHAKRVYAAAGFSQAVYVPEAGGSLYLSKSLG